jgi:hypothetical protein
MSLSAVTGRKNDNQSAIRLINTVPIAVIGLIIKEAKHRKLNMYSIIEGKGFDKDVVVERATKIKFHI